MNTPARWLPRLTIACAVVHTVYAFAVMPGTWGDIVRAGVFDGIEGDPEREAALWFLFAGIGFFAIGTLTQVVLRSTGRVPLQIAGYLLLLGVPMSIVEPASGGWLLMGLGVLALVAHRRAEQEADVSRTPAGV
ncbi:DUF6463 family protein [Thermomonospora umbrina]|uniref:Uncharacterized protein n=1 Tax=Thermomonospora umbrina TaxID=111806 RepID=A0A3D9ST59_9ACTN|nr:DUF6463 family protein [Thermomonospora umbrina]REE99132.1 hypothetical protein DFJ69_4639 [Thermomonospora umbrina]